MNLLALLRSDDGKCPLCGGGATYHVWDEIEPQELARKLHENAEWKKAHGVAGPIDLGPGQRMPGFDKNRPKTPAPQSHVRCATCASLLPPSFYVKSTHTFSLTVTGFPSSGKSTWLKHAFEHSSFGVFAEAGRIGIEKYPYAEPFQVEGSNSRTNIPFLLSGREVELVDGRERRKVLVRILDVMGERFHQDREAAVPRSTRDILQRHLLQGRRGALLALDPLKGAGASSVPPADAAATALLGKIGQAFADVHRAVASELDHQNRTGSSLWSGVVWTHLDKATWNDEGPVWLSAALKGGPPPSLGTLGAMTLPSDDDHQIWQAATHSLTPIDIWRVASAVWRQAFRNPSDYEERRAAAGSGPRGPGLLPWEEVAAAPASKAALEALIALLFRVQVAYRYLVPPGVPLLDFSHGDGLPYIDGTRVLAQGLYVLWDQLRSGIVGQMVVNGTISEVLPVGFVGRAPGATSGGHPVWGDLILAQAIEGSGALQ
jgi:hypothetical protein